MQLSVITDEIDARLAPALDVCAELGIRAVELRTVDGIQIMGDEKHVQDAVQAYVDAGVDVPIVFPLPWGEDRAAVVEQTLSAAVPSK